MGKMAQEEAFDGAGDNFQGGTGSRDQGVK